MGVAEFTRTKTRQRCPVCNARCEHVMHAPMPIGTNTRYLSRFGTLLDQFGDRPRTRRQMRERIAAARRAGHTPSRHDVYDPTLALRPGDPDAFIPADDPKGHVRRVMEKRGLKMADGQCVPVENVPSKELEKAPLAADIVDKLVAERLQREPELASKKDRLRQEVIEKHSYQRRS